MALLWALWCRLSLPAWRAHPWRQLAAWVAVALGVALGLSVHLVNEAALAEFGAAARAVGGRADATLRCEPACDDAVVDQLAAVSGVLGVHPQVVFHTQVAPFTANAQLGARAPITVLGVDTLSVARIAPDLMPRPTPGAGHEAHRLALLGADAVFANPAAWAQGWTDGPSGPMAVQLGGQSVHWRVAGTVAAGGPPLLVTDIANAQRRLGLQGLVHRVDLRLAPGTSADAVQQALAAAGQWPSQARWQPADEDVQALSSLSRAYRVNLTVLALVALFVGAFLVFSILALSVAQRVPEHALLGVLGLSGAQRRAWVLGEAALTGAIGATLGVALGAGLAALALRWLAGDLGGGFFAGVQPRLVWSWPVALGFWGLGVAAAVAGGWMPSRLVQVLSPAQALKGLGGAQRGGGALGRVLWPLAWLAAGGGLALLPPVAGLPLAAYAAVACVLVGGILTVPVLTGALLAFGNWGLARFPRAMAWPTLVLALARADHERQLATVAVAGVVASLSLSVALTVMVGSFREGVRAWLDQMLPADLYARTASRSVASDGAFLPPEVVDQAARLPGVRRVEPTRLRSFTRVPGQPPVTLVARPLPDPARQLPLVGPLWESPSDPLPGPPTEGAAGPDGPADAHAPTELDAYVSEAMATLHHAQPGQTLVLGGLTLRVRGVWKDYARQFGTVAVDLAAYQRLTGDRRSNDLAFWLAPDADVPAIERALTARVAGLELARPAAIRAQSLRIFDRSFAVTRYLQGLALAIGLFGVVASFSAQVLARRREFGLLAHLGFTRRQTLAMVALEGAAWTTAGATVGLVLGLLVAAVLVHVVNPQSFHWTMNLVVSPGPLLAMAGGVVLAAAVAAAWSARAALSVQAVRAVREDG